LLALSTPTSAVRKKDIFVYPFSPDKGFFAEYDLTVNMKRL
jgi:hypothetical protein